MKILVTGANGFIGKNLCQHLKEKEYEIITFDKDDNFSVIEENINNIDFIYHLAGVNRPENPTEFYKGNTDLTKSIIEILQTNKLNIPIVYTSSIQATNNTDYGKSKKMAEDLLLEYGINSKVYIYRLHNVFGKWCRPNYNSVVATFCYNVVNNLELTINNPDTMLELIYIDDVINEFVNLLKEKNAIVKNDNIYTIQPVYKIKLSDLAEKIKNFNNNINGLEVPETGDEFTKNMFSTFLSYVPLDKMVTKPIINRDDRGSFTELIKSKTVGQVAVSVSKPGIVRGNHYHHTKVEKFIVVKGEAKIKFRHILNNEEFEIFVSDQNMEIVNIPVGYTHMIENTGDDEMVLLIWCNELFDKDNPDTFFMEV